MDTLIEPLFADTRHIQAALAQLGAQRAVMASKPIFNTQGVKLLDQAAYIDIEVYHRLKQHQLSAPLEDCLISPPTITGRGLRAAADEVLAGRPFFRRMADVEGVREVLLDTLAHVPLPPPVAFHLTLAQAVQPELFNHAVRTALTAVWLAWAPKRPTVDLTAAATAGLLHDIGMLYLDPVLMEPERLLDAEQRRQLYAHPLVTQALVSRHADYPREVGRAILEHHECLDGSGYPQHLTGSAISDLGRILSLAEVVSSMFSPGREVPELRLSVILRMNLHRYDNLLVVRLMRLLKPETDVQGNSPMSLLDDPVARLMELDQMLDAWPRGLTDWDRLPVLRRTGLEQLAGQVAQLRRALVTVGVAPEQLGLLGSDPLDNRLRCELTLLAGETAWQLRALARQTRRRWHLEPGEDYPSELLRWIDKVEALVARRGLAEVLDQANPL